MSTKKTYSEAELKEKAETALERFSNARSVFATTDGNVFLDRNRAELHAGKGRVIEVERSLPKIEAPAEQKITAKDAIALIADATLEDLSVFADDQRKSVREAYLKRLGELGINPFEEEE